MKRAFSISLLIAGVMLAGCSAVPIAESERDQNAKAFAVEEGKGHVYVYRNQSAGPSVRVVLDVNGKLIGPTGVRTYMVLALKPGKYTLTSRAGNEAALNLKVAAGRNYYIWQDVKQDGESVQTELHLVGASLGQAGVLETRLTESPHTLVAIANAEPLVEIDPREKPKYEIQRVAFRPGISSFSVESLAKKQGCIGGLGAGLVTDKGPIEVYRMQCENGKVFVAKCELRQCKSFR